MMKKLFNFLFNRKQKTTETVEDIKGKCTTCKFADYDKDKCTVGTYLAEKGYSGFCYAGELWQEKIITL